MAEKYSPKRKDPNFDSALEHVMNCHRLTGMKFNELFVEMKNRFFGKQTKQRLVVALNRLELRKKLYRIGSTWFLHPDVFDAATIEPQIPEFVYFDSWILWSLLYASRETPCELWQIIEIADASMICLPAADELYGALNRLDAAGLIRYKKGKFDSTVTAQKLLKKVETVTNCAPTNQFRALFRLLLCPCCGPELNQVSWTIPITNDEYDFAVQKYKHHFHQNQELGGR